MASLHHEELIHANSQSDGAAFLRNMRFSDQTTDRGLSKEWPRAAQATP